MAEKKNSKATNKKETAKETKTTKAAKSEIGQVANTGDIVKAIADLSSETDRKLSQVDVAHVLRLLPTAVGNEIAKGKKIQMTGFVSFYPSYRGPRKGNNVITGESMDIPAGVALMAKAAGPLKAITHDMDDKMVDAIKNLK